MRSLTFHTCKMGLLIHTRVSSQMWIVIPEKINPRGRMSGSSLLPSQQGPSLASRGPQTQLGGMLSFLVSISIDITTAGQAADLTWPRLNAFLRFIATDCTMYSRARVLTRCCGSRVLQQALSEPPERYV